MIYAKCILSKQIAKTKEEFICRQGEEYCVYCEGETTKAHGFSTLDCVPLNYIYDCLKYGDYIAIVDVKNEDENYPLCTNYSGVQLSMREQTILRIMKADSKEAIDYVFDNVKNKAAVHDGYKDFLSNDLREYFIKRKEELIE